MAVATAASTLPRVVSSRSPFSIVSRPPAWAHWGTNPPVIEVLDAVYGYWSIVASTPRARASSMRRSVSTLLPQFTFPMIL
jgi:hypothetical protein